MRYLFLLNPAAGKQDCTVQLIPQIRAAAARAGWSEADYTIHTTEYAGHARELARVAAQEAAQAGDSLRIWTAGGDGTFMEAMTGVQGFSNAAVGCLPYGSGNDFLRTYGTRAEFTDLDAQLAGGEVTIDLLETSLGLSATICAATMIWFAAFATCPAPASPTCVIFFPMASNTGIAFSSASASPPTIIASVPFLAPISPPLTGASNVLTPTSWNRW